MTSRIRIALGATALMFMFCINVGVGRGQDGALNADQTQVARTVSAIFHAAAKDDFAEFHSVVEPGFYIYDAGARFDGTRL